MQKADIELSKLGAIWLEEKFDEAIKNQGKVPAEFISQFYQGSVIE